MPTVRRIPLQQCPDSDLVHPAEQVRRRWLLLHCARITHPGGGVERAPARLLPTANPSAPTELVRGNSEQAGWRGKRRSRLARLGAVADAAAELAAARQLRDTGTRTAPRRPTRRTWRRSWQRSATRPARCGSTCASSATFALPNASRSFRGPILTPPVEASSGATSQTTPATQASRAHATGQRHAANDQAGGCGALPQTRAPADARPANSVRRGASWCRSS